MKRSKKVTLIAAVAILVTAGIAIAAWLVTGSGPGTGKATTATQLEVTAPDNVAVGDLYPGSTLATSTSR